MLTTIRTGGTVELNWLPPLHPNGDVHYDIEYEPARIPGDPATATGIRTHFYTLSLVVGALSYNVRVVAVNTQGRTSSNVLVVCTGPERGTIAKVDVHFLTSFVFNCCFPVDGCAGAVAGAATEGFISGVLLTAAIAGVIALVVLCRAKRRGTTKPELVLSLCI